MSGDTGCAAVCTWAAVSTDPAEVRELLTKSVHDALRDLSQTEIVGSVKERARKGAMRADLAELVEEETAG